LTNLKNKKSVYVEDPTNSIYAEGMHDHEKVKITYERWGYELPRRPYGAVYNAIVLLLTRRGVTECILAYREIAELAGVGISAVREAIPKLYKAGYRATIESPVKR
jgi:hypothetical protein